VRVDALYLRFGPGEPPGASIGGRRGAALWDAGGVDGTILGLAGFDIPMRITCCHTSSEHQAAARAAAA